MAVSPQACASYHELLPSTRGPCGATHHLARVLTIQVMCRSTWATGRRRTFVVLAQPCGETAILASTDGRLILQEGQRRRSVTSVPECGGECEG